jgi:hypothetical protein
LTWHSSGDDGKAIGDTSEAARECPPPDASEKMDLAVADQVIRRDEPDIALVHIAGRE